MATETIKQRALSVEAVSTPFVVGQLGDPVDVALLEDFIAELQLGGAAGTITITIEDSADGTIWYPWVTFGGVQTGAGNIVEAPTRPPLGLIRVDISGITGTWLGRIAVMANPKR